MSTSILSRLGLLLGASLVGVGASAGPLPVYPGSYPTPNAACATFGNFVSCSTRVLEELQSLYGTSKYPGPYAFEANQGSLKQSIVVTANGGEIIQNEDQVLASEDGYATAGNDKFFTNTSGANDPTNNGPLSGDTLNSWDIGLSALNDSLTVNGDYRQLFFAFDFNNPQSGVPSLPIWVMVTVRDSTGQLANKVFETQALDPLNIFKDPAAHQSTKQFGAGVTPSAGDFATTVGSICVVDEVTSFPRPAGQNCPVGTTQVDTNQASNAVEFINYIPSMDLRGLEQDGYDTMSVQIWMGCFGVNERGAGPALAGGGSVGPCDAGGFGDIFLLAGPGQDDRQVPLPGTLPLLGLAGVAAWALRRRHTA